MARSNETSGSDFERAFRSFAEGDRSAAPYVFSELWPRLLRFCRRAVGPTDAEDCAQRAIMILFEEISDFDPRRSPLSWAYAIAAWECRTVRRKRGRSRELMEEVERAADDSLAEHLEERDLVERALALIETLPEQDQATLRADLLEELAPSVSAATHRQRRRRMLDRLREGWRKMYGP